jgi:hypothetical protein
VRTGIAAQTFQVGENKTMLRINLLPDYINDKNKVRNLSFIWGGVLLAAVAGLLFVNSQAVAARDAAVADQQAKEALKKDTDDFKGKTASEKSKRAEIEAKQTFVKNANLYNNGWADVYELVRDITPTDTSIILKSVYLDKADRKTVSVTAFGTSEKAVVEWYKNLRDRTNVVDHVNVAINPRDYAPAAPAAAATGGGMGPMGGPAGGNTGGGMATAGFSKQANMASMMSSGGMPGMGAGSPGMGGAAAGDSVGKAELRGKSGYNFTATITLKNPHAGGITLPVLPSAGGGGATGAAPALGGMGGMGGGASMTAPTGGGAGTGKPNKKDKGE